MRTEFRCSYCGGEIARPFYFDQKFCSKEHATAFHLAERKEAVALFRAQGLTPRVPANESLRAAE